MEDKDLERLIRIDERTIHIDRRLSDIQNNYINRKEFWPVKTLVYGATGIILLTVFGSLLASVIAN